MSVGALAVVGAGIAGGVATSGVAAVGAVCVTVIGARVAVATGLACIFHATPPAALDHREGGDDARMMPPRFLGVPYCESRSWRALATGA